VTWQWTWPSVGEGGWPSGFQLLSWLCLLRLRSCKYFLLTAHGLLRRPSWLPGWLPAAAGCRLLLPAGPEASWRALAHALLDLAGWLGPGRCWLRLPGRGVP
jgi:hypothetical protein